MFFFLQISDILTVGTAMINMNSSIALLKQNGQMLESELSNVVTKIENAKAKPSCTSCSSIDTSVLAMEVDFDKVSIIHVMNKFCHSQQFFPALHFAVARYFI